MSIFSEVIASSYERVFENRLTEKLIQVKC